MASLKILVPDATTNYVKNPSFRYDTGGYTAVGSTLTRVLTRARFGIASMKVVTNGAAIGEGFHYRLTWLTGIQSPITASVYLRGTGKVRLRLVDNNSGMTYLSDDAFLTDERWTRLSVSGRCSGGNDIRIYVETNDNAAKALTFYVDGVQLEPKPYETTYCDGDQIGCSWNVLKHGSLSTRVSNTRSGGRFIELASCDREEENLYVTVLTGMGVAPIRNNIQSYADAPGSYYQNTKTLDRSITVVFHAKSPDATGIKEKSLRDLHQLRNTLYDIIRPDKVTGGEEFILSYQDGDFPIYIGARYESGLEGEWDVRNRWKQSFPVRFIAVSPYMTDDNQEVATLNFKESGTVNYIAQRSSGVWSEMNGGLSSYVRQFAIGARGQLFAVGEFLKANNKAAATDPLITVDYVSYWDGTQWQYMSTGANGVVHSVAVAPNGDVYVTGAFTSIGGVAANRIAKWNGTAWSALGTGLNGTGRAVKIGPDGTVYVGGDFTTAGGFTAYYCAWYDGTWHSMGTYRGFNAAVYTIEISPDGSNVYLGGNFTDEYSNPGTIASDYVASYDPLLNTFANMGSVAFNSYVSRLFLAPSGRLYACGNFTACGSQTMMYLTYWNGVAWYDMGAGANGPVTDIHVATDGTVLVVGAFTRIGSAEADGVGFWNGTTWASMDISPSGSGKAVIRDQYGNIFVSFDGTLSDYSKHTTVENPGNAEVPANFYVYGPGNLRWIENQTTKKRIYIELDVLNGEEVFINCATGEIRSSVRGDVSYSLLSGSDFRAWKLVKGDNDIACMMLDDVSATLQLSFQTRQWGADSTVMAESL